jgi:hypothetical protein
MKSLVFALPLFLLPAAAAWADDLGLPTRMALDEEPARPPQQDLEQEKQRPDDTASLTPMEFIYRHSELEAGAMYTDFDNDLHLKSHLGYYVRWGVEVLPHLSLHATYRFNTFGSGPGDDIRVQAFLIGASYHIPIVRDFAFVGGLSVGPSWWDSSLFQSEIGFTFSAEAALTARLYEMLRLKAGVVLDGVSTDFRGASGMSTNLSYLFGLEIGL